MNIFLTIIAIAILLIINEYWSKRKTRHSELSRKFIHITVGTFVAFWPFYLSWTDIRLLSLVFLIIIVISRKQKIFKSIHSVERITYGEIFFAIAVGLVTYITNDKYIYMASLLLMSLADGLAAVVGTKHEKRKKYKIFAAEKSITGTATFLVVALCILVIYGVTDPGNHWTLRIIYAAVIAAALENVSVYGLDNLTVPIAVALLLRF